MRRDADDYPADYARGVGNVTNNGNKVVWWLLGIFGTLITIGVAAMASAMFHLNGTVSALSVKVDLLMERSQVQEHKKHGP